MLKIHPLTGILLCSILFLMILFYSHPLYIISILLFMIFAILMLGKGEVLLKILQYSKFNILLILILNPLFSQSGRTVILKTQSIPLLGRIKITLESLAFGLSMGIKLSAVITLFALYGVLINSDDNFSFFSKYLNKLIIISSMTVNIIHRLVLELNRVKEVMIMRGVEYNQKNIIKRIKAFCPLLKVVLISTLEGSIDRGEALHSRLYGSRKRTVYNPLRIRWMDYVLNSMNMLLFIILISSMVSHYGKYAFYPLLKPFTQREMVFLLGIHFVCVLILLFIWSDLKWNYSKSKT